jgi:hypothetical protein
MVMVLSLAMVAVLFSVEAVFVFVAAAAVTECDSQSGAYKACQSPCVSLYMYSL